MKQMKVKRPFFGVESSSALHVLLGLRVANLHKAKFISALSAFFRSRSLQYLMPVDPDACRNSWSPSTEAAGLEYIQFTVER